MYIGISCSHCGIYHFSQKFEEEGAKTVKIDGFKMVQSMAASIEAMMQHKIDAIKVGEIQRLIDT